MTTTSHVNQWTTGSYYIIWATLWCWTYCFRLVWSLFYGESIPLSLALAKRLIVGAKLLYQSSDSPISLATITPYTLLSPLYTRHSSRRWCCQDHSLPNQNTLSSSWPRADMRPSTHDCQMPRCRAFHSFIVASNVVDPNRRPSGRPGITRTSSSGTIT